jgi:hypothetical protein
MHAVDVQEEICRNVDVCLLLKKMRILFYNDETLYAYDRCCGDIEHHRVVGRKISNIEVFYE